LGLHLLQQGQAGIVSKYFFSYYLLI